MNDDEPKNLPKRPSLHPPQGDPKTKKITLWIVIGIAAIGIAYILLYSDIFKKETSQSQVVIPESAPNPPDTLSQGYGDTSITNDEQIPTGEAINPSSEKPAQPKEEVKEKTPSLKSAGWFTVYVGSFKNKTLAEKEKARFMGKNFEAYIVPHEGMYRVAVGQFATRDEAKDALAEIKKEMNKEGWIDRVQ
ncbi:MAG: SPOR domain-containing protein [Bacteroidetes bacterium]|nr:MAG: SPOR domain-containing protein [Bacteroidota bacterium]